MNNRHVQTFVSFGLELRRRFRVHHINDYSATLAFFWFLAIFPGFVFLLSIFRVLEIDEQLLLDQVERLIPGSGVRELFEWVFSTSQLATGSAISIGAVIAIWSASNGIARLIKLTVFAYGETEARSYIKRRSIGIGVMLALALGAIVMIVLNVFGTKLFKELFQHIPELVFLERFSTLLSYSVSTSVLIVVVLAFYRMAPQRKVGWSESLPGSVFAIITWQFISTLFSLYLKYFSAFSEAYGTVGLVIVLQIWLYLTATILLFGAEINACYPDFYGKRRYR